MRKQRKTSEDERTNETRQVGELAAELMAQLKDRAEAGRFIPEADVWESDTAYFISVSLPGLQKDDVYLHVQDGYLMISGERAMNPEFKEHKPRLLESRYGRFQRRIRLNSRADADRIMARMENGIIDITIPKRQDEAYGHKIKVA